MLTRSVGGLVGAVGGERGIDGVVELRPRVVGHAAVDGDPRPLRQALDGADAIQRHAGRADERASRLEPDLGSRETCLGEREPRRLDRARGQHRCVGRVLVEVVADAEAAAEIRDARGPAELVAARRGERREPHDRLRLRIEVGELRSDVDVQSEHVEAACERVRDQRAGLRRRKAELRAVMPGADRLVGVGVDAERDAHEHALHPGGSRHHRLVGRVEDDRCAFGGRVAEKRLALVVAVHDDLVAAEPGGPGELELAARRNVGADALLAEKAKDGHVRERLRPERDVTAVDRGEQRPRPRAERALAVDDERRAELLRELRRRRSRRA